MLTVTFKDEGQDFLEWDINKGKIVACRPLQQWVWKGMEVHNKKIRPGSYLEISGEDGIRRTLSHPVESIIAAVPEVAEK